MLQFVLQNFANFWRARSRLYQNEMLPENMRLTAFFKFYKMCILLHHCNLIFLAKDRFEKSAFFVKIQHFFANVAKFAKFQKFQLENLVDFEKCCKTRIYLQRSAPIQPKTSEILPIFFQNWQLYPTGPLPTRGRALLRLNVFTR